MILLRRRFVEKCSFAILKRVSLRVRRRVVNKRKNAEEAVPLLNINSNQPSRTHKNTHYKGPLSDEQEYKI